MNIATGVAACHLRRKKILTPEIAACLIGSPKAEVWNVEPMSFSLFRIISLRKNAPKSIKISLKALQHSNI
jgi:hypothetical protein